MPSAAGVATAAGMGTGAMASDDGDVVTNTMPDFGAYSEDFVAFLPGGEIPKTHMGNRWATESNCCGEPWHY